MPRVQSKILVIDCPFLFPWKESDLRLLGFFVVCLFLAIIKNSVTDFRLHIFLGVSLIISLACIPRSRIPKDSARLCQRVLQLKVGYPQRGDQSR